MTTEMKDSGVKWIGAVPADWKINKIKYIAVLKGRIGWQGLTSDEYTDDGPISSQVLISRTDASIGIPAFISRCAAGRKHAIFGLKTAICS